MNDLTLNTKNKTYLFLQSNNDQYMMDSEYVEKIMILQSLECPKVLPKHVIGLLEDGEDFINILDLRSLLNLEIKPYNINSKIVVIKYSDIKFGLIVENVLDIRRVKSSLIKDAPYSNSEIINQIYSPKNDTGTMIISTNAVFNILKKALDEQIFEESKTNLLPSDNGDSEILRKRTLSAKQQNEFKALPVGSDNQYTTFKIDGSIYCLKSSFIQEFFKINKTKITPVPSAPSFIRGIINIKGDFVCVFDVQNYFNRGKTSVDEKSNVIVLKSDKFKIGVLTNGINKNMNFENIEFDSNDYVDFVQNDKIYCILNIENILNSDKICVR